MIHNHSSDYSGDATESFSSMVRNAGRAGLDFIIFTDHNSVGVKKDRRDINYDGVQVIAGTEITPQCKFARFEDKGHDDDKSNGHLLIFDLEDLPDDEVIKKGVSQEAIDYANEKGALSFIAHPDHKGTKRFGVPAYNCRNFDVDNYTGFGIWDLQTDWQGSANSILSALVAFFFPAHVLKGPEPKTLRRWDELTKKRCVSIIGEIDQHAYKYKLFGLKFTIFKSIFAFKTIRTHVVRQHSVNIEANFKREIIKALKAGNTYVSMDYFDDATGFIFKAECGQKKFLMGDTMELGKGEAHFEVSTPIAAHIRVIKDGGVFLEKRGYSLSFTVTEKGAYRVEVSNKALFKQRPWIFSNTITIT